eukprot:10859788-Alexandrium_andersonii.AAC.1
MTAGPMAFGGPARRHVTARPNARPARSQRSAGRVRLQAAARRAKAAAVSYTHLRAHETSAHL